MVGEVRCFVIVWVAVDLADVLLVYVALVVPECVVPDLAGRVSFADCS